MNLLDENFPEDQAAILAAWRVPFRKIGRDIARRGIDDENIVPILHRLQRPTFFTLDQDFFQADLCHPGYCLLWLDVPADDAAEFVRRFLRHTRFVTHVKRMGLVARAHSDGVTFWQRRHTALQHAEWTQPT